jgi:hypothetical protein
MIDLHDEYRVREQHVDDRVVRDEIPVALGQAALCIETAAWQHFAQVRSDRIEHADVRVEQGRDRVPVKHAEMIGLEKGVDHQLPVHLASNHPRLVMMVALETVGGQLGVQTAEVRLRIEPDVAVGSRRGQHPDQSVAFGHR